MSAGERYYGALLGRWSGALRVTAGPLLLRLFGPIAMHTTLARQSDRFHHTTRFTKVGVAWLETEEDISIAADGASGRMDGYTKTLGARRQAYGAELVIDGDARGATYRIPWRGRTVLQTTRIVTDERAEISGLSITQTIGDVTLEGVLRRVARLGA